MGFYKELSSKPWEYQGPVLGTTPESAFALEPEKVALRLFMVVASVIFSLIAVTYYVRLDLGDWLPLKDPNILWWNTALLFGSSVCLQLARNASQRENSSTTRNYFYLSGVLTLLFIAGQLMAWNQLNVAGLGINTNPASAFFFLLTGLHGVHLIGGLWVWTKTAFRLIRAKSANDVRLSIELCTAYWHFLLVLWVLLFAALANS